MQSGTSRFFLLEKFEYAKAVVTLVLRKMISFYGRSYTISAQNKVTISEKSVYKTKEKKGESSSKCFSQWQET